MPPWHPSANAWGATRSLPSRWLVRARSWPTGSRPSRMPRASRPISSSSPSVPTTCARAAWTRSRPSTSSGRRTANCSRRSAPAYPTRPSWPCRCPTSASCGKRVEATRRSSACGIRARPAAPCSVTPTRMPRRTRSDEPRSCRPSPATTPRSSTRARPWPSARPTTEPSTRSRSRWTTSRRPITSTPRPPARRRWRPRRGPPCRWPSAAARPHAPSSRPDRPTGPDATEGVRRSPVPPRGGGRTTAERGPAPHGAARSTRCPR